MAGGRTLCSFLGTALVLFCLINSALAQISFDDGNLFARNPNDPIQADDGVRVVTPLGAVTGGVGENSHGAKYFYFRGIPYAEPPVGPLRFQDPQPVKPWGVVTLNATANKPGCIQTDILGLTGESGAWVGNEDCLFVNVFTPKLPRIRHTTNVLSKETLMPVIIVITGAGFSIDDGTSKTPDKFMSHDVVLVTVNYRLGALGFLTVGHRLMPGNMGLKDQLEAIKWTVANIVHFGGDPTRVTLFGMEGGATSVDLHALSPLGKGLYQGIIAQSGSALSMNNDLQKGNSIKEGRRFVRKIGCEPEVGELATNALRCLQNKTVDEIHEITRFELDELKQLQAEAKGEGQFQFLPTVDSYAKIPFMPSAPIVRLKTGLYKDLPRITGVVENEGGNAVAGFWNQFDQLSVNFSTVFGPKILFQSRVDQVLPGEPLKADVIRHFYTGGKNLSTGIKDEMVNMFSDALYNVPIYKGLEYRVKERQSQSQYLYRLTEKPAASFTALIGSFSGSAFEDFGVSNSDDQLFIYDELYGMKGVVTQAQAKTQDLIFKMWTNFAKFGDPTPFHDDDIPIWKSFRHDIQNYLEIKSDPELKSGFFPVRMYFWEKIFWETLDSTTPQRPSLLRPPSILGPMNQILGQLQPSTKPGPGPQLQTRMRPGSNLQPTFYGARPPYFIQNQRINPFPPTNRILFQ